MIPRRTLLLTGAAGVAAAGAAAWLARDSGWSLARPAGPADPFRALGLGGPWLNGPPLGAKDLRGKAVLVNFWTYTCINSLRPLPYLGAWADKYRDRGLVVVGAHTPEFGVEKDVENVRRAVADLGVRYPVVLDNDYRIWRAYGNNAWPGFYFVGVDGRIRHRKLGERGYEESERLIQKLLAEAGRGAVNDPIVPVAGVGPQAAPDWENLRSPETYVGYGKSDRFVSYGGVRPDATAPYRAPGRLSLNTWSLAGPWRVDQEFATLTGRSGTIAYRFHARDLHMVLAPPPGGAVRFRVRLDGADPGPDHGFDTDAEGRARILEPRMYQLVRQAGPVAERTFEIEFLDPGARAYVFTFG